jgi:hypothetical protein
VLLGATRRRLVAISAWHPLTAAVRRFPSPTHHHEQLLSGDHFHHGLLNFRVHLQRQRHRFDRSSRVVAHSVLNGLHHEYSLLARAA